MVEYLREALGLNEDPSLTGWTLAGTTLTLTDNQDLKYFLPGDTVQGQSSVTVTAVDTVNNKYDYEWRRLVW